MTGQDALRKLSSLCARGEHCTSELREKMLRWGVDADEQEGVVAWLAEHHYVDDERFARAFVHDKLKYNRWGGRKIAQALYAKGVGRDISQAVLGEVGEEEYLEQLLPVMQGKLKSVKAGSDYERNQKLVAYAVSRGFSPSQAWKCLDTLKESL